MELILLWLLIIPMLYRYSFWLYVTQIKEYRWDRLKEYFGTLQWKKAIMNIWFFIEVPLMFVTLVTFFNQKAANILFYIVSIYLVIRNVHIIIKFIRWKVKFPKITWRMFMLSTLTFMFLMLAFATIFWSMFNFIYPAILILFTFPFLIILSINSFLWPIVNIKKKKLIKKAAKKAHSIESPIKVGIT